MLSWSQERRNRTFFGLKTTLPKFQLLALVLGQYLCPTGRNESWITGEKSHLKPMTFFLQSRCIKPGIFYFLFLFFSLHFIHVKRVGIRGFGHGLDFKCVFKWKHWFSCTPGCIQTPAGTNWFKFNFIACHPNRSCIEGPIFSSI